MLLSQNGYTSKVSDQLLKIKEGLAQSYVVSISGDLRSNDGGAFKEFNFSIGHLFLSNIKTSERMNGEIYKTHIVVPIETQTIPIKVTEIDEYYGGGSIDTVIAIPFNYMNPNDVFFDSRVDLEPVHTLVEGTYDSDSISIGLEKVNGSLNGKSILINMANDIKGCHLNKSIYSFSWADQEDRISCRNFTSQLYSISRLGFSHNELREFIYQLDPQVREDRVDMVISNINWFERNFVE